MAKRERDFEAGARYLELARELLREDRDEEAEEMQARGVGLLREPGEAGRLSFRVGTIPSVARLITVRRGLEAGMEWLCQFREKVVPAYTAVVEEAMNGDVERIVRQICGTEADGESTALALLAYVAVAPDHEACDAEIHEAVEAVVDVIAGGLTGTDYLPPLRRAVEALLRHGHVAEARELARFWIVPHPRSRWDESVVDRAACEVVRDVLELEVAPLPTLAEGEIQDDAQKDHVKARLERLSPTLECRVRAWVGKDVDDMANEVSARLTAWLAERRDVKLFESTEVIVWLVEALLATSQPLGTVRDFLNQARAATSDDAWPYVKLARVFANDESYQRLAEEVIRAALDAARPPTINSRDAADLLLRLYPVAELFDKSLADQLFARARLVAGALDWAASERGYALVTVGRRVIATDQGNAEQIRLLSETLEHLQRLEVGERQIELDEAIQLLVQVDAPAAFAKAAVWERKALLEIEEAAVALGAGLLQAGQDPSLLLSLAEMASGPSRARLLRDAAERMAASPLRDELVCAYVSEVLRPNRNAERTRAINDLSAWAARMELTTNPTVSGALKFGAWLGDLVEDDTPGDPPWGRGEKKAPPVSVPDSPVEALALFEELPPDTLWRFTAEQICPQLARLANSLPSARIPGLLRVAEIWARRWPSDAFAAVAAVGAAAGTPEAHTAVSVTFRKLMTTRALRQLPSRYDTTAWDALRPAWPASDEALFEAIVMRLAQELPYLTEGALHQWVARLVELLPADQVSRSLDGLLAAVTLRLGDGETDSPTDVQVMCSPHDLSEPSDATGEMVTRLLTGFFVDLLGHPRQDTRWRAMYALVALFPTSPEEVAASLVRELSVEDHPRWLTRREWLLFVLDHLALTQPEALVPHLTRIAKHALDKDLPHATLRYHAKTIVANVEQRIPGSIDQPTRKLLRRADEPVSYVRAPDPGSHIAYPEPWWPDRAGKVFTVSAMDTMPYWYSPMAHCFGMQRCHIAEGAYRWIVDEWALTDEVCQADRMGDPRQYRWQEITNYQGAAPAVETLRTYAERHGMFLAAGELLDEQPVIRGEWSNSDRWRDKMNYERSVDTSLPSRFIVRPPAVPENYGIFDKDMEEWLGGPTAADYRREIIGNVERPDWCVVAGYWEGTFRDRTFFVHVSSALVKAESAAELVAFLRRSDHDTLPTLQLPYDCVLVEVEGELDRLGRMSSDVGSTAVEKGLPCEVRPLAVKWHQELPFHEFDPKWPERRRLDLLAPEAVDHLDLKRKPLGPCWRNEAERAVARMEVWHEGLMNRGHWNGARGGRLVISMDAARELAMRTDSKVILVVTISRNKAEGYRTVGEEYRLGSREIVVL